MGADRTEEVRTITGLLSSLDGVDDYGVPPVSVYQRFNSVGADRHGQCAVAQGARGFSIAISAGFDVAKLFAPCSPVAAAVGAGVSGMASGMRQPTSAVVLYRLQSAITAVDGMKKPLGLAQLDGVTWSGKATISASAHAGIDVFDVIVGAKASATVGLEVDALTTKLVAPTTQHFADVARRDLVDAVDAILAVEIKKACVAILAANEGWLTTELPAVALDAGVTGLPVAAHAAGVDIKEAAKHGATATLGELRKTGGWFYVIAGGVLGVSLAAIAKRASIKSAVEKLFEKSDDDVLAQLHMLQDVLSARRDRLQAKHDDTPQQLTSAERTELADLTEACMRILGFRDALFRKGFSDDQLFRSRRPRSTGAVPHVDDEFVTNPGGTSLTLTSYSWAIDGELEGGAHAGVIAASGKANAGVAGRNVSFRFRMQGANSMSMVQDTHASFFQMTAKAAANASIFHTGVKEADKRLFADLQTQDAQASVSSAGRRRFGALTYRAANVYYDTADGTVVPGVSGISLGVSVRVNPLCDYADAVRASPGGPTDATLKAFESWVCEQLACKPESLRTFVVDAPLGADFAHTNKKVGRLAAGYPVDALILEAGYATKYRRGVPVAKLAKGDVEPVDLFAYHSFTALASWRADVLGGQRDLTVMRLRYRIQSPLTATSKKTPPIGLPSSALLPVTLNFTFGRESEVGQESIVDIHARFEGDVEAGADSEYARYETNMPPVVLFNRG